MLLDTKIKFDANKARTRLDFLIKKGAKIELTEKKGQRTHDQNSFFHALLAIYAIEYGHTLDYVKQVVFKIRCNKEMFKLEHVDKETGEVITYWKSSADITTGEMTLAIDRFRTQSSQDGLYLMDPEEFKQHYFSVRQEIEKNKEFL